MAQRLRNPRDTLMCRVKSRPVRSSSDLKVTRPEGAATSFSFHSFFPSVFLMAPWCSKPFTARTHFLGFSPSKLFTSPALSWGEFLGLGRLLSAGEYGDVAVATCVACIPCQAAVVLFMQPVAQNGEPARKQTASDEALWPQPGRKSLAQQHAAERQQQRQDLKQGRMSTQGSGWPKGRDPKGASFLPEDR